MTAKPDQRFSIRHDKYPSLGADFWMDENGALHIRMTTDNVMDVLFEDSDILRPRYVLHLDSDAKP